MRLFKSAGSASVYLACSTSLTVSSRPSADFINSISLAGSISDSTFSRVAADAWLTPNLHVSAPLHDESVVLDRQTLVCLEIIGRTTMKRHARL
jgi:hypothetical protein